MDIISHGLYGGVAFGRRSRVSYWKAFLIGISPDLFSFGILTTFAVLGLVSGPDWEAGPPDPASIPVYVHVLYNVTHSLVVACGAILLIWFVLGKHIVELFAWPLHILVDIPTHSDEFFPTPFLWPVSTFHVDGVSWGLPYIFFPNLAILAALYGLFWYTAHRSALSKTQKSGTL